MGVPGMQMPDYLQKVPTMQQQQNQAATDKARAALAGTLGMGGVTGQDGRLDGAKIAGMAKKFCL